MEKVCKCTHLSTGHFLTTTTDNSLSSLKCYFIVSTHPCKAGSEFFKKYDGISGILTENTSGLGEPILWTSYPHLHVAVIQFELKACSGIFYLIK